MSTFEAALRGGAVAILLLYVVLLARDARTSRLCRYSALLLLGSAAYVVDSAPGWHALGLRWRIPIHVLSASTPAVFWITAAALFDDEFKARWYHALAWLALAALACWQMLGRYPAVSTAHDVASLCFVLLGIWHALAGRAADLMEGRRRFRLEFAVSTALYIALIIVSQWLWPGTLFAAPFSLANAAGLIALIFLLVLRSPRLTGELLAANSPRGGSVQIVDGDPPAALPATEQDAALLAALRKLMEQDKVYREEGLSIASLSQSLGVPEYRLRRLINRQLGHRNFSTFVNGYRLAEAVAALADPGQVDVPILTIALDAGFGSIGPFNRAFKAHTGRTPTEYRRARAAEPLPIPKTTGHP